MSIAQKILENIDALGVMLMYRIIKRFYGVGLTVAIIVAVIMLLEYKILERVIKQEIRANITLERNYIASVISGRLLRKAQIIKDAGSYIESEGEDKRILDFLRTLLKKNPSYESIYFGTPDNKMINGSGWIPPDTFDLRSRPWYKKALERNDIIYTEAFLNASRDHMIVTIAMPIYDSTNRLLGVIAGDITVDGIFNLVRGSKISETKYSFLLDSKGSILAHPHYEYKFSSVLPNIKDSYEKIEISKLWNKSGIMPILVEGKEGYLAYQPIDSTDWMIASYVSTREYLNPERQMLMIFLTTLISSFIIILSLLFIQRKYLIKPLLSLDRDLQMVSISDNIEYRVPEEKKDPFLVLRESVNRSLNRTQEYFSALKHSQEELMSANDELSATVQQLEAVEEELRAQYQDIIDSKTALEISEKRNRAIVSVLPDTMFVYSKEGVFLDFKTRNDTDSLMRREDIIGKKLTEIKPEEVALKEMGMIEKALSTNELQYFEYSLNSSDSTQYFESRIIKCTEEEVLAIVRNTTEQKENQLLIERLSFHDQLTKLYNRRYFDEELKRLDVPDSLPLTISMLDVNGLKLTNDAFGHLVGDELLKCVAQLLKKHCRAGDTVARIGGDEFILLLPKTTHQEAERIVQRIYNAASQEKISNIQISVSIGWETRTSMKQPVRDIFVHAEDHMYRKKLTESQSMRNQTIQAIMNTLNEKNEREKTHSVEVSRICRDIGEAMKLDIQLLSEIEAAGLLHDIGKISVREEVLNKPCKLTTKEYEEVKRHAESGYQILKSVDAYSSMAEVILSHHERWDGGGYPRGLKREEIPFVARIISVADAYQAMVSDRPYRKGVSRDEALLELVANAGTQFDPKIVKILAGLIVSR